MFPHIEAKVLVKLSDVINIFDKTRKRSLVLKDNDAVRICLLVLLEHGFLGHQLSHNVSDDMLKLVEHLSNCWNIFPWGSYIWEYTYSQLRDALHKRKVRHDAKREKGEKIQYTMTGFVWDFMIWILDTIPATHRHVHKQPTKKILRLWLRSREYRLVGRDVVLCKHVQSEVVSEQLEIEKDGLSEQVLKKKKKKRKRGSSQPSFQDPTYDRLMMIVTMLEGTVTTLTETVSSLHGTIGTLESQLLVLELCYFFWDVLYPGGEKAEYLEEWKLDGLHINAFIELIMRKRQLNAQWTLGLSELVVFYIDSGKLMSMVSVVDALRVTINGTNPRYPSWHKISQVFFPINLGNKHWVAAAWNLDDYVLMVYDSLESPENGEKIVDLLKIWKDFIKKDLENMNWFENTKRDPKCFKISLRYMSDVPKQSFVYGTLDCGVMTCKFLEMLTKGKNIDIKSFGDNVGLKCQEYRAKMALMLYETRCERAV
ncbi:phospholipase-like protein [Tanacetum coccineum]